MRPLSFFTAGLAAAVLAVSAPAYARKGLVETITGELGNTTTAVAGAGSIEVGFSPDEGAEKLVLKVIGSAQREIRMLSYSFTSAPVVRALLDARHRGVDVALIADYKANTSDDRSGKARHALAALVNAGCRVRTISAYAIHHDKTIIVDGRTVETGSFNFSDAAAHKNSENALVMWNNQELAAVYLKHWQSRFAQGQDFTVPY